VLVVVELRQVQGLSGLLAADLLLALVVEQLVGHHQEIEAGLPWVPLECAPPDDCTSGMVAQKARNGGAAGEAVHGRAGILQLEACQVCGDGWLGWAHVPCKVAPSRQLSSLHGVALTLLTKLSAEHAELACSATHL
jgi:hypothetical protein